MEVIYRSFIRNQTSFCGEIILLVSQCSMFEVSFIWYRLVCFDKLMMIFKGIANKYLYLFKASVGEMKSGKVFLIFKLLSSVQSQMSLLKGKKKVLRIPHVGKSLVFLYGTVCFHYGIILIGTAY